MNTEDTTSLLRIRRDLTGESFNDGTIDVWCEALAGWPLTECRTAIIAAARDHQRVTVRHVVEQLPPPAREWTRREEPICIRCGIAPAALLRTRCEPCQQIVHDQIRDGVTHSPAMTDAIQAARRRTGSSRDTG